MKRGFAGSLIYKSNVGESEHSLRLLIERSDAAPNIRRASPIVLRSIHEELAPCPIQEKFVISSNSKPGWLSFDTHAMIEAGI
jgi:hypothetical protein